MDTKNPNVFFFVLIFVLLTFVAMQATIKPVSAAMPKSPDSYKIPSGYKVEGFAYKNIMPIFMLRNYSTDQRVLYNPVDGSIVKILESSVTLELK